MASPFVTTDVNRIHPLFGRMQLLLDIHNNTRYYRLLDEPHATVNKILTKAIVEESCLDESPLTLIVDKNSYKMFCVGSYLDNPVFRDTYDRFILFFEQNVGKWVVRTDGILARPHCTTMQYGDKSIRLGTDAYTISQINLFPEEEETKDFSIWEESTERTVSYKSSIEDLVYYIATDDEHIYEGQGNTKDKTFRIGYGSWEFSKYTANELAPSKTQDYILLDVFSYDNETAIFGTKGSDAGWYETAASNIKVGKSFSMQFKKNPESDAEGASITWTWNGFQDNIQKSTQTLWVIDAPGWR